MGFADVTGTDACFRGAGLRTGDAANWALSSFTAFFALFASRRASLKSFFACRNAAFAAFADFFAASAVFCAAEICTASLLFAVSEAVGDDFLFMGDTRGVRERPKQVAPTLAA